MSDVFALSARRIFDGEAWHEGAALIVRGDAVESIVASAKIPAGAEIVEAGDMLTPGFVDLQVNGGSSAVVPKGACARQIVSMPSTVGWSFSITPPPPLTCRSTKPGASMAPASMV